jgi:hypothetical protein
MTDPAADPAAPTEPAAPEREDRSRRLDKVPMRMLNDRILVKLDAADEERRSAGGILIHPGG